MMSLPSEATEIRLANNLSVGYVIDGEITFTNQQLADRFAAQSPHGIKFYNGLIIDGKSDVTAESLKCLSARCICHREPPTIRENHVQET